MKRGFTLLEILLTLGIAGVAWVFISSVFLSNFKIFNEQKTATYINSQNRLALDDISNQVIQAQAVSGSCNVCQGDTTSSASVLILALWSLDASGNPYAPNLIVDPNPDYFVYKLDPLNTKNLIRKIYPAAGSSRRVSTKIIATDATNLIFTYIPTPPATTQVTIQLDNQTKSLNKTLTTSQTAKANLKNSPNN